MRIFNNLLDKKQDYTFLVSGGVDSIAACHWLSQRTRLKIKVLHFNHNWQPANKLMENSVRDFCAAHHLPFQAITRHAEQTMGKQTEKDFRQWRLACMAEQTGHTNYLTAHHLGDATETALKLAMQGKADYKPIQEKTIFPNFTIYHPFLLNEKRELLKYAETHDLLKFVVEDPTNNDTTIERNWIRHVALPLLSQRFNLESTVKKKYHISRHLAFKTSNKRSFLR